MKKYQKLLLKKKKKIVFNLKILSKGVYGLQSLENGYLTKRQMESVRVLFINETKDGSKFWIRNSLFNFSKTSKPKDSRMGKGKGKISLYVNRLSLGNIIIEFTFSNLLIINKKIFRSLLSKLPLKCKVIKKLYI